MANPWQTHIANVRKSNPGLSFKDTLIKAGKSYTPPGDGAGVRKTKKHRKSKGKGRKSAKHGRKSAKRSRKSAKRGRKSKK